MTHFGNCHTLDHKKCPKLKPNNFNFDKKSLGATNCAGKTAKGSKNFTPSRYPWRLPLSGHFSNDWSYVLSLDGRDCSIRSGSLGCSSRRIYRISINFILMCCIPRNRITFFLTWPTKVLTDWKLWGGISINGKKKTVQGASITWCNPFHEQNASHAQHFNSQAKPACKDCNASISISPQISWTAYTWNPWDVRISGLTRYKSGICSTKTQQQTLGFCQGNEKKNGETKTMKSSTFQLAHAKKNKQKGARYHFWVVGFSSALSQWRIITNQLCTTC